MKQPVDGDSVETLNRDMAEKNLGGHWQLGFESFAPYPETTVQACLWKWKDVYESLMRAGEVVSMEQAERRNVPLLNPALRGRLPITQTIQFSFQYVKTGEHARPHRHTAAAYCFKRARRLYHGQWSEVRDRGRRLDLDASTDLA